MNSKKGAIELSMTTIIIIVIGVTLLILGLVFVRTIFTEMGGISDEVFDKAQEELGGLETVDKFLTINPSNFALQQGSYKNVKIIIANFEEETINIQAKVTTVGNDENIKCQFAETQSEVSDSHQIASGKQKKLAVVVKDNDGPLRNTVCKVTIQGAPPGEDNQGTIIIDVIA